MPSNKAPQNAVTPGAGKLPAGVVPAGALLFPPGAGESAALQAHVLDPVAAHASTAISAVNTGNFADGNPAVGATVQALINSVVALLGATAGAAKVGSVNTGIFADGAPAVGATIQALVNDVVTKLAAAAGAAKVGGDAYAPVGGHYTLAAAAVQTQLNALLDLINYQYSCRILAAADVITVNDGTIILTPGVAFALTLPAPAGLKGQRIKLIAASDINTFPVTLTRTGGEKINGLVANYVLNTPWGRWDLVSDGTDWYVTSEGVVFTPRSPIASNFSITPTYDFYPVSASGFPLIATLPLAATMKGREVIIKNTDNSWGTFVGGQNRWLVLTASGGETIEGAATYTYAVSNGEIRVYSDGAAWRITGRDWISRYSAPLNANFAIDQNYDFYPVNSPLASRTGTLVAAASMKGREVIIKDVVGGFGPFPLILAFTGGETLDGTAGPIQFNQPYAEIRLYSDGTGWWLLDKQPLTTTMAGPVGPFPIVPTQDFYPIAAGGLVGTLPLANTMTGREVIFKDLFGNIATNPLVINATAPNTIDGTASYQYQVPKGTLRIYSTGSTWLVVGKTILPTDVSVGDGVESFGDFNGVNAIQQVVNYWHVNWPTLKSLRVRVQHGAYVFANGEDISILAGDELHLVGDGRGKTVITTNSSGGLIVTSMNAQLTLEDLSLVRSTGQGLEMYGTTHAKGCRFTGISWHFGGGTPLQTTANGPAPYFALAEDCEFDYTTSDGVRAQLNFDNSDQSTVMHDGFVFNRCTFRGPITGAAIMRIRASVDPATWQNIRFSQCKFEIHGVQSASATAVGAGGGLVYVDPNAQDLKVTVTDLTFDQCDVTNLGASVGGTYGNNKVLLHLMPVAYNAADTTKRTTLGTVTITGGKWSLQSGVGTDFIPFFLQCANPIVRDVQFFSGAVATNAYNTAPEYRGNGFYTNTQKMALRNDTAMAGTGRGVGWVTISASGYAMSGLPGLRPSGLCVQNVTFIDFHRSAGPAGPVTLQGPDMKGGPVRVDGVHIEYPSAGAIGNTNNVYAWVHLVPGGYAATDRGSGGSFKSIAFNSGATASVGSHWADGGIITISAEGRLVLEDAQINPTGDGAELSLTWPIYINYPWDHASQTNDGTPIYIIRPHIHNCAFGIGATEVPAFRTTMGPIKIDGAWMRASIASTTNYFRNFINIFPAGVTLLGLSILNCDFEAVCKDLTIVNAVYIQQNYWQTIYSFNISNNNIFLNYGVGAPTAGPPTTACIFLQSSNAGSEPTGTIDGNICSQVQGGAALQWGGHIRLQRDAGLTINTPPAGGLANIRNVEVGHSTVTSTTYTYTDGQAMVRNFALLQTPN